MTTVAELKRHMADAHQYLLSAVGGIPHAAFRAPLVYEPWSVADLLAHCVAWDKVTLSGLSAIHAAEPPPVVAEVRAKGAEAYDKEYTDRFASATPEQLRAELAITLDKILFWVNQFADPDCDRKLAWSHTGDTTVAAFVEAEHWGHRREHADEILKWRAANGI